MFWHPNSVKKISLFKKLNNFLFFYLESYYCLFIQRKYFLNSIYFFVNFILTFILAPPFVINSSFYKRKGAILLNKISVILIRSSFSTEFWNANFTGTKQRHWCVKECWWKPLRNRNSSPLLLSSLILFDVILEFLISREITIATK